MITRKAPAKVNLFLHVTGRREDGFHTLQSLVCFTDIGDVVSVAQAPEDSLEVTGEFANLIPHSDDNLICKLVQALRDADYEIPPLAITLEKNLPVAAGLGGGSSDATAALHAIEELLQLEIPTDNRHQILACLGSDLPICYHAQTALMEDTGHRVNPWPNLPDFGILLVNPMQPLSTTAVYRGVQNFTEERSFQPATNRTEIVKLLEETHNDLQTVAEKELPVIGEICEQLRALPDCIIARMSGSGASCFALFENREQAELAAQTYHQRNPNHWIKAGSILRSPSHG